MKQAIKPDWHWSTSSFGDSVDTSEEELEALGQHHEQCASQRGRMFALRCRTDALGHFLAARLVTTTLVLAALAGCLSLLL
jgi:hypothetical protein